MGRHDQSKSWVWKHFKKHIVQGVKYGSCLDERCPSKTKKVRKSEIEVGGVKLIWCTGGHTTNLWYHLEKDHPDEHNEEIALREKKKILRAEEELARFKEGKKQNALATASFRN